MCASYHEELNGLLDSPQHMVVLVEMAVSKIVTSPLELDLACAETAIPNDSQLDAMHEEPEYRCLSFLAPQASVVGKLRTIVSAIRVAFELVRVGDPTAHAVKIARLRLPDSAVPDSLWENFSRMLEVCAAMTQPTNQSPKDRNAVVVLWMAEIDCEMGHLRRDYFGVLLGKNWLGSAEQAIDVALLDRHFERPADHVVAMVHRVIYIITGQFPEGEEWPNA